MSKDLPVCACGCGEKVKNKGNKYILGHQRKGIPTTKGRKKTKEEILKQKNTIKKFGKGYRPYCLCGCGNIVKSVHSKYCHGHNQKHKPYQVGMTKENSEAVRKMINSRSWYFHSQETKKKIGENSKKLKHSKKYREWLRKRCLNGYSAYMNSCMKNPSRPQVELYNIVLNLCPYAILNYPCKNCSIDIAIPFLNLAIEYDGYFHFNNNKNIRYHERRQRMLENEGWNFIRYDIYEDFPTEEVVYKDILEKIGDMF